MQRQILITSKNIEVLKQKARKLKRAEQLPHHLALEQVAREAGFDHWHQICEGAKAFEPTEKAFYFGCIIAMDAKDAADFNTDDHIFVEDDGAWLLCQADLYESFCASVDENDNPLRETCSETELQEWFQDDIMNYRLFRLTAPKLAADIHEVLTLIKQRSFWPPQYVWLKGEFYDTYDVPATDGEGQVVGIRF